MRKLDLFIPGRLCLFGEHSDWASMHRMINAEVEVGCAIVTGVEEGIYATVEMAEDFIVESKMDAYNGQSLCCPMDTRKLMEIAQEGGFFSYVAGVASYINENYTVGGLKISITNMTLPIKSGLSSSAAICVLVARAFNQMYDLKMNIQGEMLVAFRGEQRTPSRCGRLDQACAYGVKPVFMNFDGSEITTKPLRVGTTFYWVIADLCAAKDTVKILGDLNKCYPFAQNEKEKAVHEALGMDNRRFVSQAAKLLEAGDAKALGKLMCEAQENFDKKVAPACPEQLTSPVLHSVLNDETIKQWIYGAKGVGSQGDGTVQFLAKDEESRDALIAYLQDERKMPAFSLTLRPGQSVKKAIIPVAGFGTRVFPVTKAIKKDFLPILDKDGVLKPVILILLEQLVEAGIEQICLVIGENEQSEYDNFFSPLPQEHYAKLSEERRAYERKIVEIGKKLTFVYQRERLGFGHAVFQCKEFTNDEPVLLLLGDMIYRSKEEKNCMTQFIEAYQKVGHSMVSIHSVPLNDVVHYGIIHGKWENPEEDLMKMDGIYEKPTRDYAKEYLGVQKYNTTRYYAVFGQYILTNEIFKELENNIKNGKTSGGEYQLTDALQAVCQNNGMYAFRPNGESYDVGLPEAYRDTMASFCADCQAN